MEIKDYLKRYYPSYLQATQLQIKQRIKTIIKNPYIGRLGRAASTRELIFTNLPYFIIYEINEDNQEIFILNILHTAMQYPKI
ncbi:MAG: type II toxin-antitoxin system RelE/ParE family toxin [Alphaproteobacteria bacterium]|nr:type II toxin-antitoxin system RelE/ParE family toxin [Alphaproteobacteria bacterium]